MKRITLVAIAAAALTVPAAAPADNGAPPSPSDLATQACTHQRAADPTGFARQFKSLGKCISANTQTAENELSAANTTCKQLQAMTDDQFKAAKSTTSTFQQYYGSNTQAKGKGAGANAFGKCVSQNAQQSSQTQTSATLAAAKLCKAMTKAQLAQAYGTKPNAFGKCVSAKTKVK